MDHKHQVAEESLVKEEKKKNNPSFLRFLNYMLFLQKKL